MSKGLDQFYTSRAISKSLTKSVEKYFKDFDIVLEPSAGDGSFFDLLPKNKRIGIDLEPHHNQIIQGDFFDFNPEKSKTYFTIGNPPFGKNSSLAVKFFNHAANFSSFIAFIVPRTFRKDFTQNKLNLSFELISEEILPKNSFYGLSGELYDVPTVFQVWKKQAFDRQKVIIHNKHPDFDFLGTEDYTFKSVDVTVVNNDSYFGEVSDADRETYAMSKVELEQIRIFRDKYPRFFSSHRISKAKKKIVWINKPDFAWRRAGSRAGEVFEDFESCPTEGFEFIKLNNPHAYNVFHRMWAEAWNPGNKNPKLNEKWDTAGQPSISKHELICRYIKTKNNLLTDIHQPVTL